MPSARALLAASGATTAAAALDAGSLLAFGRDVLMLTAKATVAAARATVESWRLASEEVVGARPAAEKNARVAAVQRVRARLGAAVLAGLDRSKVFDVKIVGSGK